MSPLIMRTCAEFAKKGVDVELWVPRRKNRQFAGINPFVYHDIPRTFTIRCLPALDFMSSLPGSLGFLVLVASFNFSVFFRAMKKGLVSSVAFYAHDTRDTILLLLLRPVMFFEIHDFYESSVQWVNRWCFSRAQGLVVTNRGKMEKLHNTFGIPIGRMLHAPNAVDVDQFALDITETDARSRIGLPAGKSIILYTGHLFSWKGVDTLLAAAEYLSSNALVYFVGGTDEDIQNFKLKVKNAKLKNVVVAGRKPHREIPLWLRAADVLVLPNTAKEEASRIETSPVKLFEYMASGRPIAASDLPSIRNVVTERMVWFMHPDDPHSCASVIDSILHNQKEALVRGERARTEAEKYRWEKRIASVLAFISAHSPH